MPKVPAAQSAPIAKLFGYPAFINAGYINVPIASRVTIPDPETAANAAQERMVAIARPPGIGAVKDFIR